MELLSSSWFLVILCLLVSAFFSGMEIAFVSANRLRIELDRKSGIFTSGIVQIFVKNPSQYIAVVLLANNLVLVIYGLIMAKMLSAPLMQVLNNEVSVFVLQTIISTLLIITAGEFFPKFIFRLNPNFFLNYLSVPLFVFYLILYIPAKLIMMFSEWILKLVGKNSDTKNTKEVFSKLDISYLLEQTEDKQIQDIDTEHEIRLFRNALDFSSVKVRDCMIPRTELVAVDIKTSIDNVKNKFIESGFSKLLVYKENIDNIIGYINIKDFIKNPNNIKTRIIPAPFVPETMNANNLLHSLLQERKSLAVVVDEFGGTSGIVTIEDIMEEIFGEIEDEHDKNDIVEKQLSEDSYIFSGKIDIETLNSKFQLNIQEDENYNTLAGFVVYKLDSIPAQNQVFEIDHFQVKILKTVNKRLELIYLKILN
ncbi:MAG TPA: hemolysin family protein [Bacteroidales bacterium]|nr:hemolysin family protein [Bacteroidales bacterium]